MATQSALQPENSTSYSNVFDEFFYSNTENNKCIAEKLSSMKCISKKSLTESFLIITIVSDRK